MPYLIQAEEQDVPYELFEQLARIMDESEELTFADATFQLHHGHGIIAVPDKAEAQRLSTRFAAVGFPNFVLEALLEVPKAEPLSLHGAKLWEATELAVVARLDTVTEHTTMLFSPWNTRMYAAGSIDFVVPGSSVDQWTTREEHLHFYLDLLTRATHWRAYAGTSVPVEEFLKNGLFSDTYRSASARKLMAGDRNIIRFQSEKEYDRHVQWLYQVRYARPA